MEVQDIIRYYDRLNLRLIKESARQAVQKKETVMVYPDKKQNQQSAASNV